MSNNTIDAQRFLKAERRNRDNYQVRDNNYQAITCEVKPYHVWHSSKAKKPVITALDLN